MKRFWALILSLMFILTLAACGGAGQAPASPSPEEPSAPESSSPSGEPEPDPEPEPLPDLRPGRIVGFWDAQQDAVHTRNVKGTQAELDRWKTAVLDPAIARLDFNNMHQESMELPVEQEQEILAAMRKAEVRLYEGNPDPSTGGGCWVTAYDGEENVLFHITYLGDFFTVGFPGEEVSYYFDGKGTTLDDLLHSDYGIPMETPDENGEWDPDPGTGELPPEPDPYGVTRVNTMAEYLWANLDHRDYGEIHRTYGEEGLIQVFTPSPDAAKSVVERYTGEPVPVEYPYVPFSLEQMEQAREKVQRFLEEHPEIELLELRSQLGVSSGYIVNIKEESAALTEFVKSYPVAEMYEVVVGLTEFPD